MTDLQNRGIYQGSADKDVFDPDFDLSHWNKKNATSLAKIEGIKMSPEHWEVVQFLRDYYAKHGRADSGRNLAKALTQAFAEKGGSKYLYRLFPNGPVAQGSRIGGLPLPEFTEDKSFGSAM
jgi:TusE/DsrC/DsvC family sulfur relay protein